MTTLTGSQPPNFAQRMPGARPQLIPKKHPITNDYTILTKCLGVGVNGKVLECIHKATGERRALKVCFRGYVHVMRFNSSNTAPLEITNVWGGLVDPMSCLK